MLYNIILREGMDCMNKILLASHGPLAKAMKKTAEFIMGENDNVQYLCAYVDEDSMDLPRMIDCWEKEKRQEDIWIVITDIFGGSVNNEFMTRAKNDSFYLLAGMSLPLVLSLWTEEDIVDQGQIQNIVADAAKETVVFCNSLLEQSVEDEDEEF